MPSRLTASDFPQSTPLNAFFAWNEARRARDRRYVVACDIHRLLHQFDGGPEVPVAHLAGCPVILLRRGERVVASRRRLRAARGRLAGSAAAAAAHGLVAALTGSIGNPDPAAHAAFFSACERLAKIIDLNALAALHPRRKDLSNQARRREILVIKLGALGDFIQALGPVPDIRRHHRGDRISLLTTAPYAGFAAETGLFDNILIDPRPRGFEIASLLALRRMLRNGRFDRVYDFQTSDRTALYARLFRPGPMPEWSGIATGCSHPHANLARDRQHTMDRQAEQLLMAGIYPSATAPTLSAHGTLPEVVAGKRFALLIPGSAPHRPEKRWPARRYAELAGRLHRAGVLPVVIGVAPEAEIGRAIRSVCPDCLDLVGHTDLATLAALARAAEVTIGNDTGATHVAAAGGRPVVALFSRASDPGLCAPRGAAVTVLAEPDLAALPLETVLAACRLVVPAMR
jgi:ADP-heptose:LPS heptosyltransferase